MIVLASHLKCADPKYKGIPITGPICHIAVKQIKDDPVKSKLVKWLVAPMAASFMMAQPGVAQTAPMPDQGAIALESGFRVYLNQVRQRALREGVAATTLDRVLPSLSYNERVVRLDRSQPEGAADAPVPNFAPYKARHVDAARISRGRAKYDELRPMLKRIEDQTGVPEEMMIAIYGHETNYGTVTGNYNAPEALASLAYEGRRRTR
jgi:membrane-bound lytic murein transglycosylase B